MVHNQLQIMDTHRNVNCARMIGQWGQTDAPDFELKQTTWTLLNMSNSCSEERLFFKIFLTF